MRNAIPFKAEVVLALAADKVEALKKLVEDQRLLIEDEFKGIEKNVEFFVEPVEKPSCCPLRSRTTSSTQSTLVTTASCA